MRDRIPSQHNLCQHPWQQQPAMPMHQQPHVQVHQQPCSTIEQTPLPLACTCLSRGDSGLDLPPLVSSDLLKLADNLGQLAQAVVLRQQACKGGNERDSTSTL
jgi:hypothetical protein